MLLVCQNGRINIPLFVRIALAVLISYYTVLIFICLRFIYNLLYTQLFLFLTHCILSTYVTH